MESTNLAHGVNGSEQPSLRLVQAPEPEYEKVPFRVEVVPGRERVLVRPVGELDLSNADKVWEQIEQLPAAGFDRIVLDLRELTFMDSTAIRLIMSARELAEHDGFDFALIDGARSVCRVLDLTGLRDHLNFTTA